MEDTNRKWIQGSYAGKFAIQNKTQILTVAEGVDPCPAKRKICVLFLEVCTVFEGTENFMEKVADANNLWEAWRRVRANKGSSGSTVDWLKRRTGARKPRNGYAENCGAIA